MGRKYYCEYCEREFCDTLEDRRKHRQSASHLLARNEFYTHLLRKYYLKYGERLFPHFTYDELSLFLEIIKKPNSCKYHHFQQSNSTETSICKHGERCANSHRLNYEQISHWRSVFLNRVTILSSQKLLSSNDERPVLSKRKIKKDIMLNLWLERTHHMDDRSKKLMQQLIMRNL